MSGKRAGSAYGNPTPYDLTELERAALLGRLSVARTIIATTEREGTRRRWNAVADELLDHLGYVDDRARSAAMDEEESRGGGAR